jgi:uncharacterized protein YraI
MTPFDRIDLSDAFNDCIDRLHAGQTIDDCLRVYPQYAAALHPLLQTAQAVHRATPAIPAGARARVWAQVSAQTTPTPRSKPHWRTWTLRAAAAIVIVILAVVLTGRLRDKRTDSIHTEILPTVSVTPTPTSTSTFMPTTANTSTLTHTATQIVTTTMAPTNTTEPCLFVVQSTSINLRSGPGTGFSVVGIGYAGEQYTVLSRHTSGLWFQVLFGSEEVWLAASVGSLNGDCVALSVSDLAIQNAETQIPSPNATSDTSSNEDDHSTESEDHSGSDSSGSDDSGSDDNESHDGESETD